MTMVFVHPTHPAGAVQVNELTPFPVIDFTHETSWAALDMVTSNMLAEHPRCKVILSHAGGTIPYTTGRAAQVLPYTMSNSRVPTKSFDQVLGELRNFYFDVAVASADLVLPLLIKFAKPGHILCGSDLPYAPREVTDHIINSLNAYERSVDIKEVSAINRDNASRLFPRLQNKQSDRTGIPRSVYSEYSVSPRPVFLLRLHCHYLEKGVASSYDRSGRPNYHRKVSIQGFRFYPLIRHTLTPTAST